jgi:hypothetical protein
MFKITVLSFYNNYTNCINTRTQGEYFDGGIYTDRCFQESIVDGNSSGDTVN